MRLSAKAIFDKKKKREKIVALTAYDYPTARILDEAGLDIILVGDSLGMVLLGYDTTLPVTMEEMLHHTKAVSRAVRRALVVADMPYRSYTSPRKAVANAQCFVKVGADAVKLEGGRRVQKQVEAILAARIPVMGHVGMTPQSVKQTGGYRVQRRVPQQAEAILKDAQLLDRLGVFSIVIECIPRDLGTRITGNVQCPTLGIGAGAGTDGQILVLHDMLGFSASVHPRFVRAYAKLEPEIRKAAKNYYRDVKTGRYPSEAESY